MHIIRCVAFMLGMAQAAAAQGLGPRPVEPPSLHLAATRTVKIAPDMLVASLSAVATAAKPVAAQQQVNALVAKAKAMTDRAAGIKTAFQGYSVSFIDDKPAHWTAQQTVEVRGADGEAVLQLVGHLQGLGLLIDSLGWQVSPDRADQAQRAATLDAIHGLRDEAGEAARALGMEVDRFQHVDLSGEPRIVPLMRGRMEMAAKMPMAAPVSTPEEQEISATVSADVWLRMPKAEGKVP